MYSEKTKMTIDNISDFGADKRLVSALKGSGFKEFRKVQADSVRKGLFSNVSQFVCSPSGSGKTLIGEMAAIHNILQNQNGKSLYLVPLRALAGEKSAYFSEMYGYLGINVVMAVGDMEVKTSDLKSSSLIIMTYEKFDSYLRDLKENPWITDIKTIIVDEIHIIGESKRGPRLESLLLRLFMYLKNIQFIALSATVANPQELGDWFDKLSKIFGHSDFEIIFSDKRPIQLDYSIIQSDNKLKSIIFLSEKIIAENGQLLVFTNSRRDAEEIAFYLSENISQILDNESLLLIQGNLNNLKSLPFPIPTGLNLSNDISNLIKNGIAFHHAGLESNERFFIEKLFLNGLIKIIVCTTTLSAGINTPARMVILKETEMFEKILDNNYYLNYDKSMKNSNLDSNLNSNSNGNTEITKFERKKLDRNVFHQILGRAGRPGYDNEGYAKILADSGTSALSIQDYYFTKNKDKEKDKDKNRDKDKDENKHPETIFRPVYNSVLSGLHNKGNLTEFILLCTYELDGISINNLEKLLEYTYFFKIGENKKNYRTLLFNVYYGELIQILKLFSTPDKIIETQSKNFDISVYLLTSKKIEGIVNEYIKKTETQASFKVRFDIHRGVYCDCTKRYLKLEHNTNSNTRDFNFCIHEIALINYLIDLINIEVFELVVNNTGEEINNKTKMDFDFEREIKKKGETQEYFKREKENTLRTREGNYPTEFKSASDILDERKENGKDFENDSLRVNNSDKINNNIRNFLNRYDTDDWNNSSIPIIISQDSEDVNLLKLTNLKNEFEFSNAIRSGKISQFAAKYIIERIINRSILGENIIEFLMNHGLIDINHDNSNNIDGKRKNLSNGKKNKSDINIELKDETGYVLLGNDMDKEYNNFHNTTFICTELGKITIKCYVYPHTALLFRNLLSELLNTPIGLKVSSKLNSFNSSENFTKLNQLNHISPVEVEKLESIFFQIIEKLLQSEQRRTLPYSTDILTMRANGITPEKIHTYLLRKISKEKSSSKVYLPDIKNLIEDSLRVLNFMCEFVKIDRDQEENITVGREKINTTSTTLFPNIDFKAQKFISERLETLDLRIKLGIPENLLNLSTIFRDFTIDQLQNLYRKGLKEKSDFNIVTPEGFSNIVQIPLKQAEDILAKLKEKKF